MSKEEWVGITVIVVGAFTVVVGLSVFVGFGFHLGWNLIR